MRWNLIIATTLVIKFNYKCTKIERLPMCIFSQYVPFIINSVGAYFTTGDPDGSFGP